MIGREPDVRLTRPRWLRYRFDLIVAPEPNPGQAGPWEVVEGRPAWRAPVVPPAPPGFVPGMALLVPPRRRWLLRRRAAAARRWPR